MKTVSLLRHAKSSWDHPDLSDLERPLNRRGKEDAPAMADLFASSAEEPPEVVFSSPATRAQATAKVFARRLKIPLETDQRLYAADAGALLEIIRGWDDARGRVMLVGHNPALETLVALCRGEPFGGLPTCGLVTFRFDAEHWRDVDPGRGVELHFLQPKMARKASEKRPRRERPEEDGDEPELP